MYRRGASGWVKHADFILLDLIGLQIACVLAYILRFDSELLVYQDDLYAGLVLIITMIDMLVCIVFNTMHNVLKRG